VAQPLKLGAVPQYGSIVAAGLILNTIPVVIFGAALTPAVAWFVSRQYADIIGSDTVQMLSIWSLLAGVLSSIAAVVMAAVEGSFRNAYRSWSTVLANAAGLGVAVPLLGSLGVAALGILACVIPLVQIFLCSVLLVKLAVTERTNRPVNLRDLVRSLWRENLKLSAIGLCRLSFEPATKLLLSLIAPLPFIAVFELALRASTQIRLVIQSAAQPLLALGARATENLDAEGARLFADSQRRTTLTAILSCALILIAAPVISVFGLGRFEPSFFAIFALLVTSNAVNIMGMVGYFYLLSGTKLEYLLIIHVLMMLLNVGGGLLAVSIGSAVGVVAAYGAAFCLGGVMSYLSLRGVLSWKMERIRQLKGPSPLSVAALILFIAALYVEVFLLPELETWKSVATSMVACSLLLLLVIKPLGRAIGRTKEVLE